MHRTHLGFWTMASVPLFLAGLALMATNWIDGRTTEIAFTVGLMVVGIVALLVVGEPPTDEATQSEDVTARRADWLPLGVMAGFVATTLLTAGLMFSYEVASIAGSNGATATFFDRWLWSLTHNPVTETARVNLAVALILHFGAGILLGALYAGYIEPRLRGAGWRKGIIFALVPWLLSLIVFFPVIGGGFLGLSLHAGPLPIIGNLVLHLIYGVTLGGVYAVERWQTESGVPDGEDERRALDRSQRASALGVAFGLMAGGFVGEAAASVLAPGQDRLLVAVIAALIGSGVGFMLGSYAGLSPETHRQ